MTPEQQAEMERTIQMHYLIRQRQAQAAQAQAAANAEQQRRQAAEARRRQPQGRPAILDGRSVMRFGR
jgi:hypothetical protein